MNASSARAVCLDASVLVKLRIEEPYSQQVRDWCSSEHGAYTTPFCFYEALNIFKSKWKFQGKIVHSEYVSACNSLIAWFGGISRRGLVKDPELTSHEAFSSVREIATSTGLDFSEVALTRARARLADNGHVELKHWDMRTEPIEGSYDLVVAMGVITSLYRPRDVRNISRSIVAALVPHGYLLFSDVRQSRVFETSWWGPMMLRGGEQIRRYLTALPDLDVIHTADTDSHVFALYRRRART